MQGAQLDKKSVKMIANNNMKCWNCRNQGHTSEKCLLDACLHCKNSMLDTSGTTVLNVSAKKPPINVLEFKTISQMMNKMTNPVILIIVVEAKAEGVTEVGAKTVVAAE